MVIKREVAYGIVRGLEEFWDSDELVDFTVTIGTSHFGCHKFLLAACSGFFRGLFRSGMKETESKSASIEDISSETFKLILEAIYTGHGVLTSDNVIDIWRAANQLQITFLIQECENFVIKDLSIDNYVQYFCNGRLLNSTTVMDVVWSFILRNSVTFFKTSCFLDLPFCDVLTLVKSQALVIKSEDDVISAILQWADFSLNHQQFKKQIVTPNIEDVNMDLSKSQDDVNDTAEFHEKDIRTESCLTNPEGNSQAHGKFSEDKTKCLVVLLSYARTCLASHGCLEMSLRHPLIKDDSDARELIIKAILYQLQVGKRNGQWSKGAIHRNCSALENVAISTARNGCDVTISAFSFSRNIWLRFPKISSSSTINLAAVDNCLFALGNSIKVQEHLFGEIQHKQTTAQQLNFVRFNSQETHSGVSIFSAASVAQKSSIPLTSPRIPMEIYQWKDASWSKLDILMTLPSASFKVAVADHSIYVLSADGQEVWGLEPFSNSHHKMSDLPSDQPICHVSCCENFILVFYSLSADGVDETAVHYLDTSLNTWKQLNNLEGPANGMTSFKDDQSNYILQANGDLWKLIKAQSDVLDFEYVVKLWSCEWSLHGAVTFSDTLYIYGVKSDNRKDDSHLRKSLPGVFHQIIYMESSSLETTTFQPLIANKKFFS